VEYERGELVPIFAELVASHKTQLSPYDLTVLEDTPCTAICEVPLRAGSRQLAYLVKLVLRQYRVHLTLDSLPVLVKNPALNYAARGFPVGFTTPPANGMGPPDMHVYNHLAFTISYLKDSEEEALQYRTQIKKPLNMTAL